jgi:hypothetical protein
VAAAPSTERRVIKVRRSIYSGMRKAFVGGRAEDCALLEVVVH